MDSSFSALRGLLHVADPETVDEQGRIITSPAGAVAAMITRPGFGLLRRGTSFSASIASNVAASLPGGGPSTGKKNLGETGQPLLEVPRYVSYLLNAVGFVI